MSICALCEKKPTCPDVHRLARQCTSFAPAAVKAVEETEPNKSLRKQVAKLMIELSESEERCNEATAQIAVLTDKLAKKTKSKKKDEE